MLRRSVAVIVLLLSGCSPVAVSEDAQSGVLDRKEFGDWTATHSVIDGSRFALATTKNETGSALGLTCVDGDCELFVNPLLECEDGSSYPVLVSNMEGIEATELQCTQWYGRHLYTFPETSVAYSALLDSNRLGVALGTASGRFKAVYFSLSGSIKAVVAARAWSESSVDTGELTDELF